MSPGAPNHASVGRAVCYENQPPVTQSEVLLRAGSQDKPTPMRVFLLCLQQVCVGPPPMWGLSRGWEGKTRCDFTSLWPSRRASQVASGTHTHTYTHTHTHTHTHTCQCRRGRFDPWIGMIPQKRKCKSLQYSCLENSLDRGDWRATVPGVAKETPLSH